MQKEYIPISQIRISFTPDGFLLLTAIQNDEFKKQKYCGYSKREALDLFREEVLGQKIRRRN